MLVGFPPVWHPSSQYRFMATNCEKEWKIMKVTLYIYYYLFIIFLGIVKCCFKKYLSKTYHSDGFWEGPQLITPERQANALHLNALISAFRSARNFCWKSWPRAKPETTMVTTMKSWLVLVQRALPKIDWLYDYKSINTYTYTYIIIYIHGYYGNIYGLRITIESQSISQFHS